MKSKSPGTAGYPLGPCLLACSKKGKHFVCLLELQRQPSQVWGIELEGKKKRGFFFYSANKELRQNLLLHLHGLKPARNDGF